MRLITWNVNGLRAVVRKEKWNQIFELDPDIVCIQETKSAPDQLPEDLYAPAGYEAYFSSSRTKKGYSGVGTYTRVSPETTTIGLDIERFDEHGRVLSHIFNKQWVLINAYFPNGSSATAPLDYKLDFYDEFINFVEKHKKQGYSIIFGGDLNVAHEEIDLARPRENKKSIGFLPEEREWIDEIERRGYIDIYRHLHPNKEGAFTYWDLRTGARERNVGWRLDYWFISPELLGRVKRCEIVSDIYGSDHAPVLLDIDLN